MRRTLKLEKEAYDLIRQVVGVRDYKLYGQEEAGEVRPDLFQHAATGELAVTVLPERTLDEGPTALLRTVFQQERVIAAVTLPEILGVMVVENDKGARESQPVSLIVSVHEDAKVVDRKNMLLSTQRYENRSFKNKLLASEEKVYQSSEKSPLVAIQDYLSAAISASLKEEDVQQQIERAPDPELEKIRNFCQANDGRDFFFEDARVTLNFDAPTDSVALVRTGQEDLADFRDIEEMQGDLQYLMSQLEMQDSLEAERYIFEQQLASQDYSTQLSWEDYAGLMQVNDDTVSSTGKNWEPVSPLYCLVEENDDSTFKGLAKLVEVEMISYGNQEDLVFHLVDLGGKAVEIYEPSALLLTKEDAGHLHQSLAQYRERLAEEAKAREKELSPMLRQFLDLKKKHPDALLLFRCGDFYETYKEDAAKAAKILGITLTKSCRIKDDQGKPLAMAGFPYHALDSYLPKLIRAGQRVAICDQIEAPVKQKPKKEEKKSVREEQPAPAPPPQPPKTYNLYTNEHGDSDRSWDDYLDFIPGEGLKFSKNDYTYGSPADRGHVLPADKMSPEEMEEARKVLTSRILADNRLSNPKVWIGSSQPRDFAMRCWVKGSKKYNGEARLMTIGSKHDRFGREVYYAYIQTPEGKNYQVSPSVIKPYAKHLSITLEKMSICELAVMVDEMQHGHWNIPGYNQHLFRWPEFLTKYARAVADQIRADEHIVTSVQDLQLVTSDESMMRITLDIDQGGKKNTHEFDVSLEKMGLQWGDEFEDELSKDLQKDVLAFYRENDRLPREPELTWLTEQHDYHELHKATAAEASEPQEVNVAMRRWQDDIAIHQATYHGEATDHNMEVFVSKDGHVFFRDPEDKALLVHEQYFGTPKSILTKSEVSDMLKREGVSPDTLLDMILNPEKAEQCYELLANFNVTESRINRDSLVEGEVPHTDISDARHLWSQDILATGATYYSYDYDMTLNEMFISPDGHVFVYYPDAKDNYWEEEIYSHYKLPDLRGMSNEEIAKTLNAFHDEHSIFRAYDAEDIQVYRGKSEEGWTCKLLDDVMMSTHLDKLPQVHYLKNIREASQWDGVIPMRSPREEMKVLESDYINSISNSQNSQVMQDYKRQNSVELTGFVASAPEFKTLPNSGKDVMTFNMALRTSDTRQMGEDGKPETRSLLMRVEKYLKEGEQEKLAPLCEKGKLVTVDGFIAGQDKYETKQGVKVNTLRLVAHNVQNYVKASEGAQSNFKNSVTISGRLTKDLKWVGKEESKLNANLAYFSAKEGEQDPKFFLQMSKFMKPEQKESLLSLITPNTAVKVEGWLEAVEFTNKEGTKVNTFNFVPKTIEQAEVKEQSQEGGAEQSKPAITVDRAALQQQYPDALQTLRQEGINPDKLSDAQLNRIFNDKKGTDLTTETGARKTILLQKVGDSYDIKSTPVKPKAQQQDAGAEM